MRNFWRKIGPKPSKEFLGLTDSVLLEQIEGDVGVCFASCIRESIPGEIERIILGENRLLQGQGNDNVESSGEEKRERERERGKVSSQLERDEFW